VPLCSPSFGLVFQRRQVTSPTPASLMALVKVLNSPSLEGCEEDPLEQVVG